MSSVTKKGTYRRVEVELRGVSQAGAWLAAVSSAAPGLRAQISSAWTRDLYWIHLPHSAEASAWVRECLLDPVIGGIWMGSPEDSPTEVPRTAAGKRLWVAQKSLRPGVTDNVGKTLVEALEIVSRQKGSFAVASGTLLLCELDAQVQAEELAGLLQATFYNPLIEKLSLEPAETFFAPARFEPGRAESDFPRVELGEEDPAGHVEVFDLAKLGQEAWRRLSAERLWALSDAEMDAIREHVIGRAAEAGSAPTLTDVEIEVFAQTWSEHCKHKIFAADVSYEEGAGVETPAREPIPKQIRSLFKTTIAQTTQQLPRPWLLSVFDDNAGIFALDEQDAVCIKVETHNSPSALDPYGGALTGIVGVNRDILGSGLGAKPLFNLDVFCVGPTDHSGPLPDRLLHPRRILEGVRLGVEHGGNKSGIPTVAGALCFEQRYLGKPLVYCGTAGILPRTIAGRPCEEKRVLPGDRIVMIGGRIGKDGIHGATFSSLALDENSPVTAVQLGDPITQKRAADFMLEARDLGLYRAVTDNGAGGLSSSVGEMARLSGGAHLELSSAATKYPGLKPFELLVSESQERMTLAVDPAKLEALMELAARRGVEASDLGIFTDSGRFDVDHRGRRVASLDLGFLHGGAPRLSLTARFEGIRIEAGASQPEADVRRFEELLPRVLSLPNVCSKEWLIRQYDHEVQGTSVIKPLHARKRGDARVSGPNDGGVIKPKADSWVGLAVGCGLWPTLSDVDPFLMAQASVDEAIRNVLAVGAEFGTEAAVVTLVDNFCWPDPVSDPGKMAALVRACFGLRDAALKLGVPLVSGKDSMKNDYRGKLEGQPVTISVPPTLLMTAVARVPDVREARTSDFKRAGDVIYWLGAGRLGLSATQVALVQPGLASVPVPDFDAALPLYAWLGGTRGRLGRKLRSAHDLSEGGLLTALAESGLASGLGAEVTLSGGALWERAWGEGFHGFIATVAGGAASDFEAELKGLGIRFERLGQVTAAPELVVNATAWDRPARWPMEALERAWRGQP